MEPKVLKSITQQVIKQRLEGTSKEQLLKNNNRTGTYFNLCHKRM